MGDIIHIDSFRKEKHEEKPSISYQIFLRLHYFFWLLFGPWKKITGFVLCLVLIIAASRFTAYSVDVTLVYFSWRESIEITSTHDGRSRPDIKFVTIEGEGRSLETGHIGVSRKELAKKFIIHTMSMSMYAHVEFSHGAVKKIPISDIVEWCRLKIGTVYRLNYNFFNRPYGLEEVKQHTTAYWRSKRLSRFYKYLL